MCLGSLRQLKEGKLIKEMGDLLKNCRQKGGQLEVFLARRLKTMPKDNVSETGDIFWKLLIYELLFLWNSLPSCNLESKEQIIIGKNGSSRLGEIDNFIPEQIAVPKVRNRCPVWRC